MWLSTSCKHDENRENDYQEISSIRIRHAVYFSGNMQKKRVAESTQKSLIPPQQ